MTALEELYLDNTSISTLDEDVFSDLSALTTLRLQSNEIDTLVAGTFDNSPLTSIDLSDNSLTTLPKDLFVNHPNPENLADFNLTGNDVEALNDGNGWQISDAQWQSSGTEFTLNIGHALPDNLTIPFTVVNGTVDGDTSAEVTIQSGETISNPITLQVNLDATAYSLTSDLDQICCLEWSYQCCNNSRAARCYLLWIR